MAEQGVAGRAISRRTIVKGAAWSVPVLMIANAVPANAAGIASPQPPIPVGHLMESSGHVNDDGVNMSSIYLVDPDSRNGQNSIANSYGSLNMTDFTATIHYTGDPALFNLLSVTLANGQTNDSRWKIVSVSATEVTIIMTAPISGIYFNSGFNGFDTWFNITPPPPNKTIYITAYGTAVYNRIVSAYYPPEVPESGQKFTFEGTVQVNTKGHMANEPASDVEDIIGPYYAVPGGYSAQGIAPFAAPFAARAEILPALLTLETLDPAVTDGTYSYRDGTAEVASERDTGLRSVTVFDADGQNVEVHYFNSDGAETDADGNPLAGDSKPEPEKPEGGVGGDETQGDLTSGKGAGRGSGEGSAPGVGEGIGAGNGSDVAIEGGQPDSEQLDSAPADAVTE